MPNTGTTSPTDGTEPSCAAGDWIRLDGVSFAYGAKSVVRDVTFGIAKGEFVTLLGPSGCGKTTLLSLISGNLRPTSGAVSLRGVDAGSITPSARRIGMVFQNYALFPHLSAWDNVGFGLDVRNTPKTERNARVESMLGRLGLTSEVWHRKPSGLSGGQQQRTAIARALVIEPDVLLMDEPFANLDYALRLILGHELRNLQSILGVTMVLVTHNREEAMEMSDRIAILHEGYMVQFDTPGNLYDRPVNRFVAEFTGIVNILSEWQGRTSPGGFLLRPDSVVVGEKAAACEWQSLAKVMSNAVGERGWICEVVAENGLALHVRLPSSTKRIGSYLQIGIAEASVWPLS